MGEYLKTILLLVLRTPLVAGNPTNKAVCKRDTDGSTSVTVLVAVTFPMTIIMFFMLTWYKGDSDTLFNLNWASKAPFLWIAVISQTWFLAIVLKNQKFWMKENLKWKRNRSAVIQLAFLWIFGIAMILQSCLEIVAMGQCIRNVHSVAFGYTGRLFSSTAKTAYLLFQLVFLSCNFGKYFIKNTIYINFTLGGLLFANGVIWLEYVSERSAHLFMYEKNTVLNQTLLCYYHSMAHQTIKTIHSYIVPVTAEYILVATLFLVNMFPKQKNTKYSLENSPNYSEENESGQNMENIKNMGYFITVFVHVPLFVLAVLARFVYAHNTDNILALWETLATIQKLFMLILNFVGFSFLEPRKFRSWKLSFDDYILLCCMVAKLVRVFPVTLSILNCKMNHRTLLLSNNVIYLLQIFYFTIYILMSNRQMCVHNRHRSRVSTFIQSVFFVIMTGRWGIESFILSEQGTDIITDKKICVFNDKREWTMIQYVVAPFSVFYEFFSAMILYRSLH